MGGRGWLTLGWGKGMDSRLGALAAGLRRNDGEAASPVKAAILQEEMAYHLVPRANDHGTNLTGPLLLRHGTPEQRERHLGPLGGGPGMVVRRLHRAPRWQRPCQHQDPRRSAGRQLRPDRPEGLWRMGPTLGLVPPAGPYRERGYRTRRAHLVPAGHVDARPLPQPRRVHHGPRLRRDISRRRRGPRVRNPRGAGAGVGHRKRVPDGSPVRLRAYRLGQKDA